MRRRLLLAVTLLIPMAPAADAAAGWSADRAQTRAGSAGQVVAVGGDAGRVALAWRRTSGGTQRLEVRLGRAPGAFTRAPRVLDRSARPLGTPVATPLRGGAFGVAWLRSAAGANRVRLTTVDREGRRGPTIAATTSGQPAYDLEWVPGPVPVLTWSRESRADGLELAPTGPRAVRLPSSPRSEPGLVADTAGLATVTWIDAARVLVSDRSGRSFTQPLNLSMGDVNRTEVVRATGATLVFWRQGSDLMVASRPDGGSFGPPRLLLTETTDAARVAVTALGDVLVVAPVGDSSNVGLLQLLRLGPDGTPRLPPQALGRGRLAQLAVDGRGGAFVAWMGESAARTITARRIPAGDGLGAPVRLAARTDFGRRPTLAATREGGAVAAWVAGGAVHARTYAP